jgi:alpha-keto-acid decarboxylase
VEDAAVLITAGVQFTDLNSGFFTQKIARRRTIEIGAGAASVVRRCSPHSPSGPPSRP